MTIIERIGLDRWRRATASCEQGAIHWDRWGERRASTTTVEADVTCDKCAASIEAMELLEEWEAGTWSAAARERVAA